MPKESPLISIVTPSLNQGAFIEENIKSVLNQRYPNFEHIIIDGCSTDGTIDILKKYDHLIWASEKDRGQSEAINKGLKRANGEIIGWLNSDDCYELNAFRTVVQELNKDEGKYIVFGDCNVIDQKGEIIGYSQGKLTHPNDFIKYWERNFRIPQPSVFFYKDILHKIDYLDEDLHYVMDYDFWLRISRHYKLYYIKKPLAKMRFHNLAKSSLNHEMFEGEWFNVFKKNRGSLFSINYYKYFLMARNFRSNLMRINAYSNMEELSLQEFRKKIMLSIANNPLNLFKGKFVSALLRAIIGHKHSDQLKRFLTNI